ncbi:hypothetical protein K9O30_20270 [Clostridium bowmanii]|uniref:hypothetical protein n=1 Tax=Clostridium bowmanii TaxID=132925 RepID=UPI001C0AC582|nr:hypothetical protein [Clostridium bowmanii]MBU3191659.1 hypothetical protein [Clostridium bowmanii]MCA1076011.1 hypothetical protein [Clostridium bowmanii]
MFKHEKLFQDYLKLKSKKSKKYITGFQECNESKGNIAIKVNLQNGSSLKINYNDKNIASNKCEF